MQRLTREGDIQPRRPRIGQAQREADGSQPLAPARALGGTAGLDLHEDPERGLGLGQEAAVHGPPEEDTTLRLSLHLGGGEHQRLPAPREPGRGGSPACGARSA
ncbi:MAG: hypothetical protein M3515_04550, partial [Actinomycetota bacterium]|nr:hypothetical protein [Actinomycetota bacterium]